MGRMTAERLEQLRDEDRRWDPGPIFYNSDTIWPLQRRALLAELDEVTRERDEARLATTERGDALTNVWALLREENRKATAEWHRAENAEAALRLANLKATAGAAPDPEGAPICGHFDVRLGQRGEFCELSPGHVGDHGRGSRVPR